TIDQFAERLFLARFKPRTTLKSSLTDPGCRRAITLTSRSFSSLSEIPGKRQRPYLSAVSVVGKGVKDFFPFLTDGVFPCLSGITHSLDLQRVFPCTVIQQVFLVLLSGVWCTGFVFVLALPALQ
ncbi:unnamed protein product, partial [Sphacelaria rigidula]